MSKVVTIPKDRNPFVVIVNGVKHSYPAGVSTEVPDEVADVIEKYEGAKPKPDPNAGINFGGAQSDWNQTDSSAADFIKNKPFGDKYIQRTIFEDEELLFENGAYQPDASLFSVDESGYIIKFDGVTYQYANTVDAGSIAFGNMSFLNEMYGTEHPDTGEPFCVMVMPEFGFGAIVTNDAGIHIVSIIAIKEETTTIAEKYVPVQRFYYNNQTSDIYLYTDRNLTIKAQNAEVIRAARNNTIVLHNSYNPDSYISFIVECRTIADTSAVEVIVVCNDVNDEDNAAVRRLYTAEYTG